MGKMEVSMEVGSDGVAVIKLTNPPVNALAIPILAGIKEKYNEAMRRNDVKAIVVTGEGGKFSGGFDISALQDAQKTGDIKRLGRVSVDLMINTIEDASKPSVAAIQGLALGGGLELAMSCHARISTPRAQLGLPELSLGILPGFGGTQRLPRLVGVQKAVEMMLLSKPITSEEGKKLGLIDALVSPEELMTTARMWALEIVERRKPWIKSLERTDKLESLGEAREILKFARAQAKKTAPNLPHPQLCLDVIEEGIVSGGFAGVLREEAGFFNIVLSETAKGLVHFFFSQRATSKVPGVTDLGLKPRQIKKVAVIGGGLMGSGIATALVLSNIPVVLKEVNANFLQQGLGRISANLKSRVKKGNMSEEKFNKTMSLVTGVVDYAEFKNVDMVIEAVIEKIPLKQEIFSDLERICPPHCVLATNTSTIDLNIIGAKTHAQDRIIGAHFFSPAHVMQLLEIIRTEKTSPQNIIDLMNLGKRIKKVPVVVGNCMGFAINRMFFPYTHGAHLLANLGIDIFRIDRVITSFGMPMGPFRLSDLVGYEVGIEVGKLFVSAFPDRTFKSPITLLMLENKRAGQKNGKGYYLYDEKRKARPDPSVKEIIEQSIRMTKIMPGGKPVVVTDEEILGMLFFPVVNEACRVLDEGIAVQASDLDVSSVLGFGFPAYRGGIMFWADSVGAGHIYSSLKKWYESFGGFFKPCVYLEERAAKGISLSAPVAAKSSRARL
uniref:TSA: Wollemia nobilis Ref_Wollemi_Transcript_5333_2695 transcribed RNA sequence n=1 Tax=Wollemia nobilis TaxID=56998 RepID=A0A0C9RPJ6_9CONI